MAENTEKPALPPTPTRIQLAKDIKAKRIRHYRFFKPETTCQTTGNIVTARVRDFVRADLALYGEQERYAEPLISGTRNYSIVSLTPAGEEWLTKYGSTE